MREETKNKEFLWNRAQQSVMEAEMNISKAISKPCYKLMVCHFLREAVRGYLILICTELKRRGECTLPDTSGSTKVILEVIEDLHPQVLSGISGLDVKTNSGLTSEIYYFADILDSWPTTSWENIKDEDIKTCREFLPELEELAGRVAKILPKAEGVFNPEALPEYLPQSPLPEGKRPAPPSINFGVSPFGGGSK